MGIRTLTITVRFECDDHALEACAKEVSITETTLKAARAAVTNRGWRVTRETGRERVRCPGCYARFVKLVAAGILNRRGEILDMGRWEAERR